MINCNICGTTFTAKSNYYRHRKKTCIPNENIKNKLLKQLDDITLENIEYENKITELNHLTDQLNKMYNIEKLYNNLEQKYTVLLNENNIQKETINNLEQKYTVLFNENNIQKETINNLEKVYAIALNKIEHLTETNNELKPFKTDYLDVMKK